MLKTSEEEIQDKQQTSLRQKVFLVFNFPMTKFASLLMFLKSRSYVNMELFNCLAVESRIHQTKTDSVENIPMK